MGVKRGLLILTFVSVIVLGALHQLASALFLYWDVWWFDVMMHFIGGFAIALLYIWFRYRNRSIEPRGKAITMAIVFVVVAGFGWEAFEYYFDIANPVGMSYLRDTSKDIVLDLFGAIIGALIGTKKFFHV